MRVRVWKEIETSIYDTNIQWIQNMKSLKGWRSIIRQMNITYVIIFLPLEEYNDLKWAEENPFSSRRQSCVIHFMNYSLIAAGVAHTLSYHLSPSSHSHVPNSVPCPVCPHPIHLMQIVLIYSQGLEMNRLVQLVIGGNNFIYNK